MAAFDAMNFSSDSEGGTVQAVKLEQDVDGIAWKFTENRKGGIAKPKASFIRQEFEENRNSESLITGQSGSSVVDQEQSSMDDGGLLSSSSLCPPPLCRQFWKAGNYDSGVGAKVSLQNGKNHLQVHPKFLHSNATSHKWVFGAIAELVDNAVDEIHRGASFVNIDKTINPRDGTLALLIQDDGGGMDPETMRQCMSFGFSGKKSDLAIGQYGNGFKTSTMRLGADVVVFSRNLSNKICMQSIGLLSYTFLTRTERDRIVVPMFHDIGSHGTKVIINNLWFNEDRNMELDFDTDPEDIRIGGDTRKIEARPENRTINEQHIANRLRYSLREYLSILYLRIPQCFKIVLRQKVVAIHNLADDLKFPEYILYRPQSRGSIEGTVVTTIGFLKEAPRVNIHGFNVYHKNRLILPFWQVVRYEINKGRGVVGVLQANFMEPTHNKQDFEKTSLLQKLEARLKEMTWEYWDFHCGLIGYQVTKKVRTPLTPEVLLDGVTQSVVSNENLHSTVGLKAKESGKDKKVVFESLISLEKGASLKRKERNLTDRERSESEVGKSARTVDAGSSRYIQPKTQEVVNLLEKNKELQSKCLEYEKMEEEYNLMATEIQGEIKEVERNYSRLLAELESMGDFKG